jgi:hypothetical protein
MLYLAFGASVAGLLALAFILPSVRPPLSNPGMVGPSSVERAVRVRGIVSDVHCFKGGSMVFSLSGSGSELRVFLPVSSASGFGCGDLDGKAVEASGVVKIYRGSVELYVGRSEDLVLL